MKKKILNTIQNLTTASIINRSIIRDPFIPIPMWIVYGVFLGKIINKESQSETDNSNK